MEPKSQYMKRQRKQAVVSAYARLAVGCAIILLLINHPPHNIWNAVFLGVVASVLVLGAWITSFTVPDPDDIYTFEALEARMKERQ